MPFIYVNFEIVVCGENVFGRGGLIHGITISNIGNRQHYDTWILYCRYVTSKRLTLTERIWF